VSETTEAKYGKYFVENTQEIRYLDPLLGTELDAHHPPPSLLHNAFTKKGLENLRTMAEDKRLMIQLVQGYHGNATDFPDMLEVSGEALPKAQFIASELAWNSTTKETPNLSMLTLNQEESVGPKEFHESQVSWLRKHEKTILPCDRPTGEIDEPYQSYGDLLKLCWEATKAEDLRADIIYGVSSRLSESGGGWRI